MARTSMRLANAATCFCVDILEADTGRTWETGRMLSCMTWEFIYHVFLIGGIIAEAIYIGCFIFRR